MSFHLIQRAASGLLNRVIRGKMRRLRKYSTFAQPGIREQKQMHYPVDKRKFFLIAMDIANTLRTIFLKQGNITCSIQSSCY